MRRGWGGGEVGGGEGGEEVQRVKRRTPHVCTLYCSVVFSPKPR